MKKKVVLLLSLLLIFSACSNKEQSGTGSNTEPEVIISQSKDENLDIGSAEEPGAEQPEGTENTGKTTEKPKVESKEKTEQKKPSSPQESIENKDNTNTVQPSEKKETDNSSQPPVSSGQDAGTGATQTQDAPIVTEQNIVRISIQGDENNILTDTDIEFKTGDTVLDILIKITRDKKIHMDFSGSKESAYIKGIDNLYEFDRGPNSGWKYTVNGVYPAYSAGSYKVEKGDIIKWIYVK